MLIAISGASCSGKSTLAKDLANVFEGAIVLHQDDYYKPPSEIPKKNTLDNWDCPEAFDFERLGKELNEILATGTKPTPQTSQSSNDNGCSKTSKAIVERLRLRARELDIKRPIVIIEGILLFHRSSPFLRMSHAKLLLQTDLTLLKQRRESRTGYTCLEDEFYEDPPNYFEDLVWPEYIKHNGYLLQDAKLSAEGLQLGLRLGPKGDPAEVLEWAFNEIANSCVE